MEIITNTPLRHVPADYCPTGSEKWFTLTEGYDKGKILFYYDYRVGDGTSETTVLFVHGNPENSYTWRHTRDALMASGKPMRVIALDHVGFGLSDQADFEMVDMHHAANLAQLVRHLDLQDVTLVVHDWGGPIGTGAFLDMPERVKALMVANTTIFPMPDEGYTYKNYPFPAMPWYRTPNMVPDALWGAVAGGVVGDFPQLGFWEFQRLFAVALYKYAFKRFEAASAAYVFSEQFRTKANAVASKRHVRQTPFWGHGYAYDDPIHGRQDNHDFYRRLQQELVPAWRGLPAGGLFGGWDPCGKEEVIDQWLVAFPAMADNLQRFPGLAHFVEEGKGPEIADGILKMNGF